MNEDDTAALAQDMSTVEDAFRQRSYQSAFTWPALSALSVDGTWPPHLPLAATLARTVRDGALRARLVFV